MSWNYKLVYKPNDVGRMLPRDILYSPDGIEIEANYVRHWSMLYSGRDLKFEFIAWRDVNHLKDLEWRCDERSDLARCIGPDCLVRVDMRTLSRELSLDEIPMVSVDIRLAMRVHWKIPISFEPRVERISFRDDIFLRHSDY